MLRVDRPFAFCGARRGAGPPLVIGGQLLERRRGFSLRLRQCRRDFRGRRFRQINRYARRLHRFHIPAGARAGRRGLLPRGLVAHGSPAPLVERAPPVLLGRDQGQHAEEASHLSSAALCCPSASAANQGCPAAEV